MSKSVTTIHKEILKKEHEASPQGQLEKKLRTFYDNLVLKGQKLPESVSKKIFDLRDKLEKDVDAYIEMTLKRDREANDEMLFNTMTKEWELLEEFTKQHNGKL